MEQDWHNKKCRDCDNRVKDVDPANLSFQGNSHCRARPPNLMFVAAMGPQNKFMVQPLGSHYTIVDENTAACRLFEPHGGNVRRNIINSIPAMPPPGNDPIKLP